MAGRSYIRRKSAKSFVISLKLSPAQLRSLASASPVTSASTPTPAAAASIATPDENASESNTPAPSQAGGAVAMPPPEGKKKGVKRGAQAALGGDPVAKVRGKPGPKKKIKVDDGSTPNGAGNANGIPHKLGPKANQGAINAGLRALDRSGKPTRKWHKRGFVLKSFTGIVWEINRWNAPTRSMATNGESEGSMSGIDSGKENKESTGQSEKSENSTAPNVASAAASIDASSPAPVIAASA